MRELIQDAVARLNTELASYGTIKKFAVLPADLTVEGGELTANLKLKRKAVEQRYKDTLDRLYKEA